MPITIHQSPATISPAYNPLDFVISSTQSGSANHKYIVDVKSGATLLKRIKQPATENGVLRFDASRIVQDYVTQDIGGSAFAVNSNSYKEYFIEVSEEYEVAGVVTTSAVLATSATLYAFNAAYDYLDFIGYTQPVLNGSTASFLTNAPTTQNIQLSQLAWLYGANTGTIAKAQVKTYNSSGTLLGTYEIANADSTAKFIRLPSGTSNLNSAALSLGVQPVITDSVAKYTVQVFDATPAAMSKVITYQIQDAPLYENWRLHFLNRKGGVDSFNFTLVSKHSQEITRNKFKKSFGSLSGNAWSYSKSAFGEVNYHTQVKDRFKVTSDWLTEAESNWLAELVASPVVFRELNGELVAISVDTNSYEKKKKNYERMINLELDLSYTYTNTLQRG